jgi:hypothetical protein
MSFFGQIINCVRLSNQEIDDNTGRPTPATETQFTIVGSIQPTTGKDLEAVPENRRDSALYKIYTTSELVIATTGRQNSDRLSLFGEDYEVISKLPWQNSLINHFKYIVGRVKSGNR